MPGRQSTVTRRRGASSAAEKPARGRINQALERLRPRGRGGLAQPRPRKRRKIIVITSDGVNAKTATPSAMEDILFEAAALGRISPFTPSEWGLRDTNRGTTTMSHYAHATGGDIYYAAHPADLSRFYAQVSEQARHQYTNGCNPTTRSVSSKDYHSIEVRIRRPGLSRLPRSRWLPPHSAPVVTFFTRGAPCTGPAGESRARLRLSFQLEWHRHR